jgi:hypothetical protein
VKKVVIKPAQIRPRELEFMDQGHDVIPNNLFEICLRIQLVPVRAEVEKMNVFGPQEDLDGF